MLTPLPARRSPSLPLPPRRPQRAPGWRPAANTPAAREIEQSVSVDPWLDLAAWNCDRVRERTVALVGEGGHHALLLRSLARVREEFPWLSDVHVEDGYLTGLAAVLPEQSFTARKSACIALRKQYVGLLFTFLGEGLTRNVVSDDWPELLPSPRDTAPAAQPPCTAPPAPAIP